MAKGKLDIGAIKTTVSYSPHELQTLDVYRLTESPFALWIMYSARPSSALSLTASPQLHPRRCLA